MYNWMHRLNTCCLTVHCTHAVAVLFSQVYWTTFLTTLYRTINIYAPRPLKWTMCLFLKRGSSVLLAFFLWAGTKCSFSAHRAEAASRPIRRDVVRLRPIAAADVGRGRGKELRLFGGADALRVQQLAFERAAARPDGGKQPESLPCRGRWRRRRSHVREGHPGEWGLVRLCAQVRQYLFLVCAPWDVSLNPLVVCGCRAPTSCLLFDSNIVFND